MRTSLRWTACWLIPSILIVGTSAFGEVLTLDRCIEIALKNNYQVISAKYSYEAAKGEVYSAYGKLLPTVDVNAYGTRRWSPRGRIDFNTGRFVAGATDFYGGGLDISQSFGGLGLYTYANIRYKDHSKMSSYYSFQASRKDIVYTVKENYYNLIKAKMLLDVAKDAVRRGEEQLKVAQSRYDLGLASLSDVLKARVQFGNDKLDLVSQENAYKLAQANLNYVMGRDVNLPVEVEEQLVEPKVEITFNEAVNEALSRNPLYKKSKFDRSASLDQLKMAYANYLPRVTWGVSHATDVSHLNDILDFRQLNASYSYYVRLSFNIFSGFSDLSNLLAARKNVQSRTRNVADTQNKVMLEIKQAFLDLQQARERLKLTEESVASAQQDLDLAREKYKLGSATIIEVLDAEVSLKQAQTDKVQALFDYNLAASRLDKAMGR